MHTPAAKKASSERRWRPIVSLVQEMSDGRGPLNNDDRFAITKKVFLRGVLQGLSGRVLKAETALFRAGDMQMVGAFVEGEAMGLAISDRLWWWRASNWSVLHAQSILRHPYELYTGLGMGIGVFNLAPPVVRDDSRHALWEWFAIDGFGFQQALCNPRKFVLRQEQTGLSAHSAYGAQVFDQGLGRSLWFLYGGDADAIAKATNRFDEQRKEDIWVGIGVAAAHTAGTSDENILNLVGLAGDHRESLAVGAIVAAHVKSRAGTKSRVTDDVCYALAAVSSEEGADIVEDAHRKASTGLQSHRDWQRLMRLALKERSGSCYPNLSDSRM